MMIIILISISVNAEVPHEEYKDNDDEINKTTVLLFIGKTLEDMNNTFQSILDSQDFLTDF